MIPAASQIRILIRVTLKLLTRPAALLGILGMVGVSHLTAATQGPASQPLSPSESLARLHLPAGFKAEIFAAEPLLESPVAIDWDAQNRLWVVEMIDYPLGLDGRGKAGGRIRVLEDTDGDGRPDKSTIFADGLKFPTGILTWRDGVLVTAAPEILFLRDTDGDGRADSTRVLFSGFLEGNQQLRVNSLRWGLDNRVHCASGAHHGGYGASTKIRSHLNGRDYEIGSRDFRFHPDTGELEAQSGPSQYGRNPDDWGNWFGVQNSWPLWHYVLQDHYIRRNPHIAAPDPVQQVLGPRNPPVFPASAMEKRFHSFNEAGHFTSACSAMIYRDELLFGPGGERHAFTCEPFHNLVQHIQVTDSGVSFSGQRIPGEANLDFFASEDRWCRPVMARTGPDGALWVVDMYRYMIEHPEWLPAEGKAELLPHYRLGEERGRIYRIFPKARQPRKPLRLAGLPIPSLVAALDSPNGWQRDKVQMMLLWAGDSSAVPLLEQLARGSATPAVRAQALATLDGLERLKPALVKAALEDRHPGVRILGLRLAEPRPAPEVQAAVFSRIEDRDPKVALQLACTLGQWQGADAGLALSRIATNWHQENYITAAVLSSALSHGPVLAESISRAEAPIFETYFQPLAGQALATNQRDTLALLLRPVLNPGNRRFTPHQFELFSRFADLLERTGKNWRTLRAAGGNVDNLARALQAADQMLEEAATLAADAGGAPEQRLIAAGLLARDEIHRPKAVSILSNFLKPSTGASSQRTAIETLAVSGLPEVPQVLAGAWPTLGPANRMAVVDELLRREPWAVELMGLVEADRIPARWFDAGRRDRILRHRSPRVRELAKAVFEKAGQSSRSEVLEKFKPALNLAGDAGRGRELFMKLCVTCHRAGGLGNDVGPNLQSVLNHPPEKLLVSILDPNASIEPGFTAYTVVAGGGEEIYGIVAAETGNSLVMKTPDGRTQTVLRGTIQSLSSANLSLMPEGLENGLTPGDLADLIQFLRTPQ